MITMPWIDDYKTKQKQKKHFKSQKYYNMYVHCTKMVNKTVNRDGGCLIQVLKSCAPNSNI